MAAPSTKGRRGVGPRDSRTRGARGKGTAKPTKSQAAKKTSQLKRSPNEKIRATKHTAAVKAPKAPKRRKPAKASRSAKASKRAEASKPAKASTPAKASKLSLSTRRDTRATSTPAVATGGREPDIKELDPQRMCGARTSVKRLFRLREIIDGVRRSHLVFYDRHGWYCEHGRGCHAVTLVHRAFPDLPRDEESLLR